MPDSLLLDTSSTSHREEGGLRTQGIHKKNSLDKPLVTVITIVLNDVEHVEKTIQSVLNQDYPNIEYLIFDGKSTDGTVEIIKKYTQRIDYWISTKDGGMIDALNKAIDAATGEWVHFLHSGDYFIAPDTFTKIFSKPHTADLLYGGFIANFNGRPVLCKTLPSATEKAWQGMQLCHSALFTRLKLMQQFKFNPEYKVSPDGDFVAHCVASGCTFERLDEIIFQVGTFGNSYHHWLKGRLENWKIARTYFNSWRTNWYHGSHLLRELLFRCFKTLTSLVGLYQLMRYIYRKKIQKPLPPLPPKFLS